MIFYLGFFYISGERRFVYFADQRNCVCHGATNNDEHAPSQTKGQHW